MVESPAAATSENTTLLGRYTRLASVLGSLLVASRFVPIWLATGLLFIVTAIVAPSTLSGASWTSVLPLMTFVAVAALGQTLVIMTGGIDLSIPGVMVLAAHLLVGVSGGPDGDLTVAILASIGVSALIGLFSGLLVGVLGFNALIVTLAVGQIALGVTFEYAKSVANEAAVPDALASFATTRVAGVSAIFWLGLGLTIVLALLLRSTRVGRRFQSVGANPRAAWIAGVHVRSHVVFAYVVAAIFSGIAGILLAGFLRSPSLTLGNPYLLAPIAAVVLAGASLSGGLASVMSTWVAAFALTLLNQMLDVLGLSSALQFIVFGAAIIVGTIISGDRIARLVSPLLQRPGAVALFGAAESTGLEERRETDEGKASLEEGVADTGTR